MFRKLLVIFLLNNLILFADEMEDPFTSSFLGTQDLISTNVNGVSVITGEWTQHETDFIVIGPLTLSLSRIYATDPSINVLTGQNWNFNRPKGLYYYKYDSEKEVIVRLPSGSRVKLRKKK